MRDAALIYRLVWRYQRWNLPGTLLMCATGMLLVVSQPTASPIWIILVALPVLLVSAALTLPTFTHFEKSLPIDIPPLMWSRIVGSLAFLWLPLLSGLVAMRCFEQPLRGALQPFEFAAAFTACACLATAARCHSRSFAKNLLWIAAAPFALWTMFMLPWQGMIVVAALAAAPPVGQLWWMRDRRAESPAKSRVWRPAIWPLIRFSGCWKSILCSPLIAWLAWQDGWGYLIVATMLLAPAEKRWKSLIGLPVSPRFLLWSTLIGVVPFVLVKGVAPSPGEVLWTPAQWHGINVSSDRYRQVTKGEVPSIVAPWGEVTHPFTLDGWYNPFAAGPQNSERFFRWQFGRATEEVYGEALQPEQLAAKLAKDRPRMRILRMAAAAAGLLLLALLATIGNWHRLQLIPAPLRLASNPLVLTLLWLPLVFLNVHFRGIDYWLLRLSIVLPRNNVWMAIILTLAILPMYFALEAMFRRAEFPEKGRESA